MDKKVPELEDVIDCRYAHLLKSEGERQIASFLDKCGVRYMYEAPVVVTHHGKQRIWYPDFLLPDLSLYIEYFGLAGRPDYDLSIIEKMDAYANSGLQVIPVYPQHVENHSSVYLAKEISRATQERSQLVERQLHGVFSHYARPGPLQSGSLRKESS